MAQWNLDLTGYKVVKYPTATVGGTMNSSTTANTYTGTYTEVVAASGISTDFYFIGAYIGSNDSSIGRMSSVKIGIGASASEVDIWEGGAVNVDHNSGFVSTYPIKIDANSRVAIDVADNEAAANGVYWIALFLTER